MRNTMAAVILFFFVVLSVTGAEAQTFEQSMKVRIDLIGEGALPVAGVYLSEPFQDRKIHGPFSSNEITLSLDVSGISAKRADFALKWHDGSLSTFPILISSAFAGKEIQVVFGRPAEDAQAVCPSSPPILIQEAFIAHFRCAEATKRLEIGNKWTLAHLTALNAWHVANRSLFERGVPSPYGLDPHLIKRLRELVWEVDHNKFSSSKFKPIRVEDVRATLNLLREQDVMLAGLVPTFVQSGALTLAKEVNQIARDALVKISDETGSKRPVAGVNIQLLDENSKYIQMLSSPASGKTG